ncbi:MULTISPECIES: hypothetical protein [Anaerolinea]|uniref:hypothetical protein n=1 Tax=Anaerolinea TaxID=233189 RepID=UPI002633C140|nr:hypothetical protein [Anaerolinea thermophila]
MSLITIFTAPKPFTDPHIALIQHNAIRSWLALGEQVEVILLGEEEGLAEAAALYGVRHLPQVQRTPAGTPLVSSMFALAREHSTSPLLCCVNADILLTPDLLTVGQTMLERYARFLVVGQRWDLDVREPLDFSSGWAGRLRQRVQQEGKLHKATGSDYFLFPRGCFTDMPAFAIGRAGWDNWMIYSGRAQGFPVVDATHDLFIVHQNHDYRHLPGGQPHYKHPETLENVRLAGGRRAIFELPDVSHRLVNGKLVRPPLTWQRFWREVEVFPLVKWHSYPLAVGMYFLLHPKKAYREYREGRL